MKKVGFIDYYLDEWHANQYPAWIRDATGGAMEVAFAYGMKDAGHGLSNKEWCAKNGVTPCGTIEEVVARSDYLIVLSPDNPEQHEALAELPLASGKPTYIDKTFAPDRAAALRLFERAARHRTPLYSSSALRYAAEYAEVEREGIQVISSWGPGLLENYSIHQIEPIVALMGTEAKRVMYTGTAAAPALLIEFSGGLAGDDPAAGSGLSVYDGRQLRLGSLPRRAAGIGFFPELYTGLGQVFRDRGSGRAARRDDCRHQYHRKRAYRRKAAISMDRAAGKRISANHRKQPFPGRPGDGCLFCLGRVFFWIVPM